LALLARMQSYTDTDLYIGQIGNGGIVLCSNEELPISLVVSEAAALQQPAAAQPGQAATTRHTLISRTSHVTYQASTIERTEKNFY
jgi:hypothetical protein